MSEQAKDLRNSVHVMRRHKILIGVFTVLGLLGGAAYSVVRPAAFTSTAVVLLPQASQAELQTGPGGGTGAAPGTTNTGPDPYMQTQIVIVTSDPVLSGALAKISPVTSPQTLRKDVQVKSPTPDILSISAQGTSAAQAEARTNAVAASYVAYITSVNNDFGPVPAHLLSAATSATGSSLTHRIIDVLLGVVLGMLAGLVAAFAISRTDRRLFRRDEIARSIGIPVLASFPVGHPADAAGWARLLEGYKPGDLYGWRLRHALQQLGLPAVKVRDGAGSGGSSLAVVSLSSDPKAVALGPQLAVYAASLGIPTALVIGPHEDTTAAATLRTACAAAPRESSKRSSYLHITVSDGSGVDGQLNAALTVVVVVIDSQTPQLSGTMSTTATVIGVSAGVATAEQLARAATSAAADGRLIAGILVADPEPTDTTTGRIPQPSRPPQYRSPTQTKDPITKIRR
jgi:capsular polysaccharide biosynthesis protein